MKTPPNDFWGKLDRDAGTWHPLIDHCADVGACFEALVATSSVRLRLDTLSERPLTSIDHARLSVLAALHDLGKFNHGFQRKADDAPRDTAGHVNEIMGPIRSGGRVAREIGSVLGDIVSWQASPTLLGASICHHGGPPSSIAVKEDLWSPSANRAPYEGIARLVAKTRQWFPLAWGPAESTLPSTPAFGHAFCGLVTLADWAGSDTEFFPYSTSGEDRMGFARERAREMLRWVGADTTSARRSTAPSFQEFTGFDAPRPAQAAVIGLPLAPGPSLSFIEAETGSGKTEAALARFFALHQAGEVDGLYFAVPTRSAAVQLHRRLDRAAARAFGDHKPPVTLAVPGYLRVDDAEGRHLPHFRVLWNDDSRDAKRHRGWSVENPKRYFAGAIVVGTVDQVLLSALHVRHANLRAAGLLRMLLVVDEVHASDAYMTRLTEQALRFHLRAGGHAVLMSATLGAAARTRYESLLGPSALPDLESAIAIPYPRVAQGAAPVPVAESSDRDAKTVEWRVEHLADEPADESSDSLVEEIARRVAEGYRVLVIRNLVRDARSVQVRLQRAGVPTLRCNGVPAPHHSRYAALDRRALDGAVEAALGKDATRGAGMACVATQTVEQSLDIDADLLVTDLCPVDVLLQRIGRLHRHPRPERPGGEAVAKCVVLAPTDFSPTSWIQGRGPQAGAGTGGPHGLGTVYADLRMLTNTMNLVGARRRIAIPADNRDLVERATHPEALRWAREQEGWAGHVNWLDATRMNEGLLADLNSLRRDQHYVEIAARDDRKTPTRLGDDDRVVRLPEPFDSAFGQSVRELTIPGFYAKRLSLSDEPSVQMERVPDGSLSLSVDGVPFIYSHLGLDWG